jgi:branched-chain amino acid transport system permease protein
MNTIDNPNVALSGVRPRLRVIPLVEVALLIVFAILPAFLEFFWVVFATRVLILGLLALSIDLIWGHAGILCFGQALFYGAAAYTVAVCARDLGIDSIFIALPLAIFVGMALALLLGWLVLLGRFPPSPIFVALGTLTGRTASHRFGP